MIDRVNCARIQERMAGVVAGAAGRRERLELEAHARGCGRCAEAFADLTSASIALTRAYAPLRETTVALSPARVRLALRTPAETPAAIRLARLTSRFTEVALAAAVTAFAFVGSASVAPAPEIVDETAVAPVATVHASHSFNDDAFVRWIRVGRVGAASAGLVDPTVGARHADEEVAIPDERAGLAR